MEKKEEENQKTNYLREKCTKKRNKKEFLK